MPTQMTICLSDEVAGNLEHIAKELGTTGQELLEMVVEEQIEAAFEGMEHRYLMRIKRRQK